ncbi:MAG: family peptidase [Thermoleophilia bacterium]|nr:family peptidase [Thermoleophilia bacterium]
MQVARWGEVEFARAVVLARAVTEPLGIDARDGLDGVKLVATNGTQSKYDALRHTAFIGRRSPQFEGAEGDLAIVETALHEATHHMIRRQAGWPGLLAIGQPGILGEGLAETVAGATMALLGSTERERAYGWRTLDPHGQTTRIGRRTIPLSLTIEDLHTRGHFIEDGGGVHVHGGIVQNALWHLARAVGLPVMLRITGDTLRTTVSRASTLRSWAFGTLRSAEHRYGAHSRQAQGVRDAWTAVHLVLPTG